MSKIKIDLNKTIKEINVPTNEVDITDIMTEKVDAICNVLLIDSNNFEAEVVFQAICDYIGSYDRIFYTPISSVIYTCYNQNPVEEAHAIMGTMSSNIIAVVNYAQGAEVRNRIESADDEEKKQIQDAQKVILKIWDHVNLAQMQYSTLKQTDAEYEEKFNRQFLPIKDSIEKDLNSQLLTMVSIFTALAFLIFGGISSLDNIFSNSGIPLLKVMIIGCVWGLCILNLVFVFLFCVGKMTKLNFKSTDDENATIFQKYPIVWWSNFIIISIMVLCMWGYYITKKNIHTWFDNICFQNPVITTVLGTIIIICVIILIANKLIKVTRNSYEVKK